MTWRTGNKLGRTLYIQTPVGDIFVGLVDTPELAALIVETMNRHPLATQGRNLGAVSAYPSVGPDDDCSSVVAVDSDGGVDAVPEDTGPVLTPPVQADLPVVPLDALGDDASSGHA